MTVWIVLGALAFVVSLRVLARSVQWAVNLLQPLGGLDVIEAFAQHAAAKSGRRDGAHSWLGSCFHCSTSCASRRVRGLWTRFGSVRWDRRPWGD
jgi:hypothetical protein